MSEATKIREMMDMVNEDIREPAKVDFDAVEQQMEQLTSSLRSELEKVEEMVDGYKEKAHNILKDVDSGWYHDFIDEQMDMVDSAIAHSMEGMISDKVKDRMFTMMDYED